MPDNIFGFSDQFGYDSPFNDWLEEDRQIRNDRIQTRANDRYRSFASPPPEKKKLVKDILAFCKSRPLWNTMGSSFSHWKKPGLGDLKLNKYPIEMGKVTAGMKGETITDEFGPIKIVLNEDLMNQFTIPTYAQVLFQELGNAKKWKQFKKIYDKPKKYSREEYIRRIEKLEFDVRLEIINAYLGNQFDSPDYQKQNCIFTTSVTDFEAYYDAPELAKHKEGYGKIWDEETKK